MPTILDESRSPARWLFAEAPNYHSRDEVTIAGGAGADRTLRSGTVLGLVTGGDYVALDPAAETGEENAAGILLDDVVAPDGEDVQAILIVRDAQVNRAGLVWPEGIAGGDQTTAEGQLAALGIVLREGR